MTTIAPRPVAKPKPLPPLEILQEKLEYDPETGALFWKCPPSKNVKLGDCAGTKDKRGYLRVMIGNSQYRAHRLIWKLVYGEDPPPSMEIDHINRDPSDNRLSNLRLATARQNNFNSDNRSKSINLTRPSGEEIHYHSINEAASEEGLSQGNLSAVLLGKRKQTKGYTARYAD